MIPRALRLAVLAVLLVPCASLAQARPFPYEIGSGDAVLLPLGLGLSVLSTQLAEPGPLTREVVAALDPTTLNGFDRPATGNWSPTWAHRSDWTRDGLIVAAGAVAFAPQVLRGRWRDAATLGAIFGETYLLLRGTTYTAKRLADRKRPYVYNTELGVEERLTLAQSDDQGAFESFFSGHAASAFAAAALLSTVYADVHGRSSTSDLLWGSGLSVAAFTAWARVKAGKHFPSDVLAGAAVGTAIGILVPRLHRKDAHGGIELAVTPVGFALRVPVGTR